MTWAKMNMIEIMSDHWLQYFDGAPKRTLDAGETLFRRGDQVEWAFLVSDGRLFLQRALQDGGLLTLHTANTGGLVAEASLFADCHCALYSRTLKYSR
ncbi:cyclic nucleotide-binding domain-containing protein [uncultured Roseobacter sp.]|uniref:cyclic nucleotide-binding domain-containing protein n=1 Tax=uncultured Roseobacter sp. TaxID=114847 RepID=UPI0026035BD8|nr:cyclic nucleotide-binding domain-containing protein [uncultured Roseobacter sp.]